MSITVLRMAPDTVEVSLGGIVREHPLIALAEAKQRAQDTEIPQYAPLGGLDFAIQAQGAAPYKYQLRGDEATIRLTDSTKMPAASVRLSALGLALYDAPELYSLLYDIVEQNFGPDEPEKLSRIDVCVDFQGFDPTLAGARFVCPAEYRPIFPNVERPETFMFGRGDCVARVYNKTKEIAHSGKEWMVDLWSAHPGYRPELDVWRFEIQLRRKRLRELGCDTPTQGFALIPEILRYGLSWCDLRVPVGESSDRWPRHETWEALAEATGSHTTLERRALDRALASLDHIVPAVAGYTVSAGAALDSYDFGRVWSILGNKVRARLARDADFANAVRVRQLERLG